MGLPSESCRPTLFVLYLSSRPNDALVVWGKTTIMAGETAVKNLKDCNNIVTLRVDMYIIANN